MHVERVLPRIVLKRPGKNRFNKFLRRKPVTFCLLLIALVLFVSVIVPPLALKLLGIGHPVIPSAGPGLQIFDRNNQPVCTIYGDKDQQIVPLAKVSPFVVKAFVAAEDHDYYAHSGIDMLGVIRAIAVDIQAGHPIQGGSTISQQLVKNLYFEGKKRTIADKLCEALMALDIEKRYSKERILEAYLNCVYFGRGVYGVERAAQSYFGKSADKLNLAESAFLAGLVTAPSELSRSENRKRALLRQTLTLNSIQELKLASAAEVEAAKKQKLKFQSVNPGQRYQHYTEAVVDFLKRKLPGEDVYSKGLRIYTHMDAAAQELAETTLARGIRQAPKGINQGALVSVSVQDGGIVAMVGGAGTHSHWNQALSPHTAGSAFKPFVYLAALNSGAIDYDTIIDDGPVEIHQPGAPVYRPKNYDGQYLGPITLRKALALSRNTCAVRIAQLVGMKEVIRCARQAGIESQLDENLSLALGSSAVSPLEMAQAYATLARGGQFIEARMVKEIKDINGHTIRQFPQASRVSFSTEPVAQLVDALQDVVTSGTGSRARLVDRPVAGKTGTSDQGKDIWFVGFTPDLVTAVWGGNDRNKPVNGQVTGGSVMTKIWHTYMNGYYDRHHIASGAFAPPVNPLVEDAEPTFIGRFHNFFDGWFDDGQTPADTEAEPQTRELSYVQEYSAKHKTRAATDANEKASGRKIRKKGIVRKFLEWLDL